MNRHLRSAVASNLVSVWLLSASAAMADTLTLSGGRTITGTVLQTNGINVLVLTEFGALNYAKYLIEEIRTDEVEEPGPPRPTRILESKGVILSLAKQAWATGLRQIPATVIETGSLRHVPYLSYRCGHEYEVNIYGNPDDPAGIEAGLYGQLLADPSAKRNCLAFVLGLLERAADQDIVGRLNPEKDLQIADGLAFEVTPPSAPDAYGGWWISVYSDDRLERARASAEELKRITVTKASLIGGAGQTQGPGGWSEEELGWARPASRTVTLTTPSGLVLSNVQARPYVAGVSLLWRDTISGNGGVVSLADQSAEVRLRFGYDAALAAAAEGLPKQKSSSGGVAGQAEVPASRLGGSLNTGSSPAPGVYPGASSGESVYVRSYYRKDGTYVHGYTRRK
jgi:hypothetical protein